MLLLLKYCKYCMLAPFLHSLLTNILMTCTPNFNSIGNTPKVLISHAPTLRHCQNAALSMSLYSECTFIACYVAFINSINHGFMLFSFRKQRISSNPSTSQLKICSVKQLKYHRTSMLWMNDSANEITMHVK